MERIIQEVRAGLPRDAFQRRPERLAWMFLHAGIACGVFAVAGQMESRWIQFLLLPVAGNSLLSVGLLAHDLSHGSILKRGRMRACLEIFFWSFVFASRTVWKKVHNVTHHQHYGTHQDPDRHFLESEKKMGSRLFTLLFLPTRLTRWNPLIALEWIAYWGRNYMAVFLPKKWRPSCVPAHPSWSMIDRLAVLFDLGVIVLFQGLIFWIIGGGLGNCLFVWAGTYFFTSLGAGAYIFTNHTLNSIRERNDPLGSCTSVIVPKWVDSMHGYFSYHTEHHLFPNLDPRYYPEVSRILQKKWPDRYERIPFQEAWRRLWRMPFFEKDEAIS